MTQPIQTSFRWVLARTQRGLSLVELMVGMVIGLIGVVVIFQVFAVSESYKRTTTSGGDAQQNGTYATYALERQVRLAGSGLARVPNMWGCKIISAVGANALPAAAAFPAPFAGIPQAVRLAPLLIKDGGGSTSDQLVVASGSSFGLNTPAAVTGVPSTTVSMLTTVGIQQNDLILAVAQTGAAPGDCTIAKVSAAVTATTLTVAQTLAAYNASAFITNLGPKPTLVALGIDASTARNSLVSYDLLQGGPATNLVVLADNIVNLQALYGVDTSLNADGIVDAWVPPTGVWSYATLTDGSAASLTKLGQIAAVRIVVVARSTQIEKLAVSPSSVTLFSDLATAAAGMVTVDLTGTPQRYRYKIYETTIPLRNQLLSKK